MNVLRPNLFMARAQSVQDRPSRHAQVCADFINQYWLARGYNANARVVERSLANEAHKINTFIVHEIQSDTINGMPINKIEGAIQK